MELFVFTIFAAMAVGGAILLVSVHNIVRSVLAMILSFVGVAGLYLVLNAEFLAAIQVLVYVGAVAVLILFAVMLTRRVADPNEPANNNQSWLAFSVSVSLFGVLSAILAPLHWPDLPELPLLQGSTTEHVGSVLNIGQQLLGAYAIPFEVASVVLLVALLGAIILARD